MNNHDAVCYNLSFSLILVFFLRLFTLQNNSNDHNLKYERKNAHFYHKRSKIVPKKELPVAVPEHFFVHNRTNYCFPFFIIY